MNLRRVYMVGMAAVAWFALVFQFPLSFATARANGMTVIGAVVTYFSFFTILTNLLVALGITCVLLMPGSRWGRFFSSAVVSSGTALYIAVVGLVYSLLLRSAWNPEGLQKIVDILLHDVIPIAYVVYWAIFVRKTRLRWNTVALWLIYPLVYLLFTLVRGAISGWYPYPFINVMMLGYPRALVNAATLLIAFSIAALLMIAMTQATIPDKTAS